MASPQDPSVSTRSVSGARQPDGEIALDVFRRAIEYVPVATSITDTQANILYVNPAFERLSGYTRDEVVGRNESLLSDKATPIAIYKDLWATITAGAPWQGRLVNRTKDGRRYLADLNVVPVSDATGAIIHFVGMHNDVTDLHQLESKVKNQDALITSVVEAAPVVIVLLDSLGRVVFSNQAYQDLKRETEEGEPADVFAQAFQERHAQGDKFPALEISVEAPNAERHWFSCSASKVHEHDMSAAGYFTPVGQSGLLFVASDITLQRQRYEQARTNAMRALVAEQQMAQGMREIVSGAIFQLQGPLNVMSAAAQMMERQNGGGALAAPIEEVLKAGGDALEKLKAALPHVADEPVASLNINELIREVLDVSIDALLREGIFVDWRPAKVLPNVPGRANALRTMIKNLVDNAIFAIKDAGGARREIVMTTRAPSSGDVKMEICDSGGGLDEAIRLKIYEPFFSAWKKTRSRPGMGLVLARQIVAAQGGSLKIDNLTPVLISGLTPGGCKAEVIFAATDPHKGEKSSR